MNFGQIKEQVEIDIGASIPNSTMGRWINSGQKEVAKRYGTRVRLWFPPALAHTTNDIAIDTDDITLDNGVNLPASPASVIIGDGGLYEIVTYQDIDHIGMRDMVRGADGTEALPWPAGTPVRTLPESAVEYDLPNDILTLHEVRDLNNRPIFKRPVTADRKMSVITPGMYYLIYTRVPELIDFNDDDSELEVHSVFYDDIVTFCLAKYWQSIAEAIPGEENKAQMLMGEFTRSVEMSAKHLNRIENQQYTIGIELW